MTSLAVVSSALLSRHVHWAAAAIIVLGLVAYLVVIGCTSKHVLIPSFITLTPNPLSYACVVCVCIVNNTIYKIG